MVHSIYSSAGAAQCPVLHFILRLTIHFTILINIPLWCFAELVQHIVEKFLHPHLREYRSDIYYVGGSYEHTNIKTSSDFDIQICLRIQNHHWSKTDPAGQQLKVERKVYWTMKAICQLLRCVTLSKKFFFSFYKSLCIGIHYRKTSRTRELRLYALTLLDRRITAFSCIDKKLLIFLIWHTCLSEINMTYRVRTFLWIVIAFILHVLTRPDSLHPYLLPYASR